MTGLANADAMTEVMAVEPFTEALAWATEVIRAGGLVALPTETVYGLAADAASPSAVRKIYRAKGRPAHNPLIVHLSDGSEASRLAHWPEAARALAAAFWPGPLTLVCPVREGRVADDALAGGTTVALRTPDAPLMRAVASNAGALVAPSANRSGRLSATTADAVLTDLGGRIDLIIDGGATRLGLESTVLDVTGPPRLLRPGALSVEAIEAIIGPLTSGAGEAHQGLRSPGLLSSHYAPRAGLRLDVDACDVRPDEAFLVFGGAQSPVSPERTFRLSTAGDLAETARRLFEGLRTLDASGAPTIAVSPIPAEGIGLAIRDRLNRAAAPRPSPHPSPTAAEEAL